MSVLQQASLERAYYLHGYASGWIAARDLPPAPLMRPGWWARVFLRRR